MDSEIKGKGNSLNYKYRMHDPRVGRFFAVDPLAAEYPWNSVYAFSENRVIDAIELEGLEKYLIHTRAFAPFKRFGPLYMAKGDNRDFTMDTDVSTTSRLSMITSHDIQSQKWETTYFGSISTFFSLYETTSEPNQKGVKTSYGDTEHAYISGNDDAAIPFVDDFLPEGISNLQSPKIDLHNYLTITTNENNSILNISGELRGGVFPNAEAFIEDPSGNKISLAKFATDKGPQEGPLLYLWRDPEFKLSSFNIEVEIDTEGNFQKAKASFFNEEKMQYDYKNIEIEYNDEN